jgi:hypothetical protein
VEAPATKRRRAPMGLTGTVIGTCMAKHPHQKFVNFLRTIDREVPKRGWRPDDLGQLRHPHAPRCQGLVGQFAEPYRPIDDIALQGH